MRGFKNVKKQYDGRGEISRQNSYEYLIKVEEKVDDKHTEKARQTFETPAYDFGKKKRK